MRRGAYTAREREREEEWGEEREQREQVRNGGKNRAVTFSPRPSGLRYMINCLAWDVKCWLTYVCGLQARVNM